jgi:hypothetical protein
VTECGEKTVEEGVMFEVVFQGGIASGADPDEVKARIGALFKVSEAQLARLFSGQRIVIKSNLDEATAAKYKMAIEKAGALCSVVPVASAQTTPPAPTPTVAVAPAQTPPSVSVPPATASSLVTTPSSSPQEGSFNVAPLGVDLGDNKPFVPADIKVDHLSTAPVGADLEQLKVEVEPFHLTIDFDLAPVGSDLDEMPRLTAPLVISEEMDSVSIAPVGTDLSDVKPVEAPPIKELQVDIAPAGSDLGSLKKEPPPSPPDTSHLSVESN